MINVLKINCGLIPVHVPVMSIHCKNIYKTIAIWALAISATVCAVVREKSSKMR